MGIVRASAKRLFPPLVWKTAHYLRIRATYLRIRAAYSLRWRYREIVSFTHKGAAIRLVIVDKRDLIQAEQARGTFYEIDELERLALYFPAGGSFIDIGANTGQHSIYFAKILGASKVIPFEPVPLTCRILRENFRLNEMEQIADLSMLGFGLSDRTDHAQFDILLSNLGAARLEQGEGSIPIETGDHFLRDEKVDFIKIDTEGFELKVLRGLPSTIARNKPAIFVEVENRNLDNFLAFVQELNYRIEWRYRRYPWNENYLILPR